MSECMPIPDNWKDSVKEYSFKDIMHTGCPCLKYQRRMKMTVIIRQGSPKSDEPHIFRCRCCNTIFKTDEYRLKPDYRNGTFYIAVCPVCNKEKAYEE